MPDFGTIELNVETRSGTSIAQQTYTPDINIGNVASNKFNTPEQQTFEFDVTTQDDYVLAIYAAPSEWSDCIVGQLILTADSYSPAGINPTFHDKEQMRGGDAVYDLQGRKVIHPTKAGIYIHNGRKLIVQ